MQSTNAISLTSNVKYWLANTNHPRILHIFDQVCNLINERGEILSIVSPKIQSGPFNIVIEENICFSRYLNVESPIFLFKNQLILARLTINTASAKLWNPRPDWERLHARRNEIFNQLMSLSVLNYQPSIPNSLISNFSSALVNEDIAAAKMITSRLAGLGVGLTPTGDDYILGGLLAAWIIYPPNVIGIFSGEIANTAVSLTTSLSAAWLKSAGKGEAGILWHDLFDALFSTNSASTQSAIDKILSVGETSGLDSLSGFINTFLCWQELKSVPLHRHVH
jgi:hypothetical protein